MMTISWKEFEDKAKAEKEPGSLTRKCWRCHKTKPLTEKYFKKAPHGATAINPSGRMNQCRQCFDQREMAF